MTWVLCFCLSLLLLCIIFTATIFIEGTEKASKDIEKGVFNKIGLYFTLGVILIFTFVIHVILFGV
jgi:choline-glycine betaine transporter